MAAQSILAANPAADKPLMGPPPAWVKVADLPADIAPPDQNAVRVLLQDQQIRLLPNGGEYYNETMVRIQTPQGLTALGTLSFPWKPDTSTLTVHRLRIIRDGKVIDLLGKGDGFTVLRRENRLEYATLDGVLTAVIQPEGLQVGDILDEAITVKSIDPTLAGNSEQFLWIGPDARAAHWRMHIEWDSGLPIRWRQGDGLPRITEHHAGGRTMLDLAIANVDPIVPPNQAPPRFMLTRYVQLTSLRAWNDLSALFAPLYARAAVLKPDSPLKAEIARIAASSPDPGKRAEAALALVQDKVRYVFLGLNDGGLVPADADLTWQRRFGDCKGKTVLLLALLHGLGIEADPAIVSTQLGDGMDERLPMVGLFDHVIVRTTIAGKTYWLDGTRTGDIRLTDIAVPAFRSALPLRTPGAALETLTVPVPRKPLAEYSFRVDMSDGATLPITFHVEEILRGDQGLGNHLQIDNMTADVRQQALRDYFAGQYSDVEPKTYSAAWDPATGEEKLVMDGLEKHDWRWSYEADRSGVGWTADFNRGPGPHRDAPFAVGYPFYTVTHETVLLPNGGKGFANATSNVDRTVAGIEYHRQAKLDGATFTVETSARAVAREFPAKEAPAAQQALRDLAKQQALLAATADYQQTSKESAAALALDPKTAWEYNRRAAARAGNKDLPGAIADYSQAITLAPGDASVYSARAWLQWHLGKIDEAIADYQKATVLNPAIVGFHVKLAQLFEGRRQESEALSEVNKALTLSPDDGEALSTRANINDFFGHDEAALADSAAFLKKHPEGIEAYEFRVDAYMRMRQPNKALAEAKAAVAAKPTDAFGHFLLGKTYTVLGRRAEAMAELNQAIAIKPTDNAYLARIDARPEDDIAGKRADVAAAMKLDPRNLLNYYALIDTEMAARNYPAVIAAATAELEKVPGDMWSRLRRGTAYAFSGRLREAKVDYSAFASGNGNKAALLNSICWEKATNNVALLSALEDCDASLNVNSDDVNTLDSRAFVLFRLGRYEEAIQAYDKIIEKRPDQAASLYIRGLIERHLGKTAEGDKDVAAAAASDPTIVYQFAKYGVIG